MMMRQNIALFSCSSKTETVINESDIDDIIESIYRRITSNIQISSGKGSGWTFTSVVDHTINILKYNTLIKSSYIKLLKELDHPKKG